MVTGTKQTNEKMKIKRYKIQHSIEEYTFPKEAYIHNVTFDENYMHVELTDERVISIPLMWIPTLYNASAEHRKNFEISQNRRMIIWDPEKSGINDEINIIDYLGPTRANDETGSTVYAPAQTRKQIAEAKRK
jgi:Protein of unknown function (DUF2442)